MIYFDNAATTYPKPEIVYTAVNECQRNYAVNAGRGTYRTARQASEIIRSTRVALAKLVNISPKAKAEIADLIILDLIFPS